MIKAFKHHYGIATDKMKSSIVVLRSYLEKARSIIMSFTVRLVILVIVAVFVIWLGKFTWKHLSGRPMFMVSPITFSFESPDWGTDMLADELKHIRGLDRKYNIFEKNLTKKVAKAYESNPLVSKVYCIERVLPDRINIKLKLRKPIAIVKRKGKEYLVDKDCVRLPSKFYKYPEEGKKPVYIINKRSLKVVECGEEWDNVALKEGVNLLNYLKYNRIDKLLKITAIDVSNIGSKWRNGKSDINIWTENGKLIKWGRAPSSDIPSELSNHEKLQNLLSVANEEGVALAKMEYVDVRWKTPIGRYRNIH